MKSIRQYFHDYGLGITLFLLFLVSWVLHGIFDWHKYASEAAAHHQAFKVSEFFVDFMVGTFENWQSEFLQLFAMVTLTAVLIHKGSHESKDTDEKFEAALRRIEEKVDALQAGQLSGSL